MGRKKGSKNRGSGAVHSKAVDTEKPTIDEEVQEKKEQEPEFVSAFEAAEQLNTSEPTIKLWADHGHLKRHNGRISVRSIRECRFNRRRPV